MGPAVQDYVPLPQSGLIRREFHIYPTPVEVLRERKGSSTTSQGSFVLIDDDGVNNEATRLGHFTQTRVFFDADCDKVKVGAVVEIAEYSGSWDLTFVLPEGDQRRLVVGKSPQTRRSSIVVQAIDDECHHHHASSSVSLTFSI